jgi:hypothetical protein
MSIGGQKTQEWTHAGINLPCCVCFQIKRNFGIGHLEAEIWGLKWRGGGGSRWGRVKNKYGGVQNFHS